MYSGSRSIEISALEMVLLKIPVGGRGGAAVGVFDIHLSNGQVALDHVERGVAEQGLEAVDVAAVAQEVDGEGVAESEGR